METTITIRIRRQDWVKMRKLFKSFRGETAQSYIFRLREYLEEVKFWSYGDVEGK
jgi:hypothetical protein